VKRIEKPQLWPASEASVLKLAPLVTVKV